jgi:hypothetical protein
MSPDEGYVREAQRGLGELVSQEKVLLAWPQWPTEVRLRSTVAAPYVRKEAFYQEQGCVSVVLLPQEQYKDRKAEIGLMANVHWIVSCRDTGLGPGLLGRTQCQGCGVQDLEHRVNGCVPAPRRASQSYKKLHTPAVKVQARI